MRRAGFEKSAAANHITSQPKRYNAGRRTFAMKTLYLLRHAKSSWDDHSLADHDRPLAARGRKAAPQIAVWLRTHAERPQLVLCSTAARARQTWTLIAPELLPAPEVQLRPELYEADADTLVDIVRRTPAPISSLLLVGHNPAMEGAADRLAGDGDQAALQTMRAKYPTAALAEVTFDLNDWRDIEEGSGRLARFVRPKDLAAAG